MSSNQQTEGGTMNDVMVSVNRRTLTDGSQVWDVSIAAAHGVVTLSAVSELAASHIATRLVEMNQYAVEKIIVA
jgi:hypothetical protein